MNVQGLLQSPDALPSIPRVIALVLNELNAPEPDLRKIGSQLKEDPVLTIRLLALANSARFNLSRGVSSIAEALPLLGLNELRDMMFAAAVASAFRQVAGVPMQDFWRYSLNTAKLARKLAMNSPHGPVAYSAGLLHATGELVLHRALPKQMAALDALVPVFDLQRASAQQRELGFSYAEVGAAFARAWNLPAVLVDVLEHQLEPGGAGAHAPLAGVVHLASWRARVHERNIGLEAALAGFPAAVATALSLSSGRVLDEQIIDWASVQEIAGLL